MSSKLLTTNWMTIILPFSDCRSKRDSLCTWWVESTCQRILHILSSISGNWSDWSGVCPIEVLGATGPQNNTKTPEKKNFFKIPNYVTLSAVTGWCLNTEINRISVDHMVISSFIMVDQYKLLTKAITMLAQCQHLNLRVWLFFRYHKCDGCGDTYFQCRLWISQYDKEVFFNLPWDTERKSIDEMSGTSGSRGISVWVWKATDPL